MLNRLTGSRQTARVSKTPGRTQLLNFFDIDQIAGRAGGRGRLVDLPGYGYAKAGRAPQEAWQRSVNEYLSHRDCLEGVVLVMDIRHPFQPLDQELLSWAHASDLPALILLNKADKLKFGAQKSALLAAQQAVKPMQQTQVLLFSALRGEGVGPCVACLSEWLGPSDDHADVPKPSV